jgi:hypothetical protein
VRGSRYPTTCGGANRSLFARMGFAVSHPFAKNANGWGTLTLSAGQGWATRPSRAEKEVIGRLHCFGRAGIALSHICRKNHLRWGQPLAFRSHEVRGLPPIRKEREWMGHPHVIGGSRVGHPPYPTFAAKSAADVGHPILLVESEPPTKFRICTRLPASGREQPWPNA